jgi:hypothetical protein
MLAGSAVLTPDDNDNKTEDEGTPCCRSPA